ncbi:MULTISPECIES: hypothetical protein [unclassified Rathayibacter]|uniref:hypothetical protein n=1 Tax=unclassified Rathayibacter TaxID=2609250 RepID=UPI0006F8C72E|nr:MULTISPECIES: hypothetical protein [unclassified Rathayibacter]KQP97521.1 hypothetical protein ASF42_17705 [Rathayibacter sp. Leaf294]KQS07193.1 hypothetical protein ASG06_18440 [Rathayibacter sp. Leaf185]
MTFGSDGRAEREPVREFRPSRARQKQESRRLRPAAVVPAAVLLAGATWGILTADDRQGALYAYLGLFGVAAVVSAVIIGVLLVRNRRFHAEAVIRIRPHAIEYTNARGETIAFDSADPSVRALLAWLAPGPNSEGIRLPPSLILFLSDRTRSIRLRGGDWEIDALEAVVRAADPRLRSSGSGRRSGRSAEDAPGTSSPEDVVGRMPPAWEVLSARQVDDLIPGTMSFRETRPMTFALLVGFGSAALLLAVVIGVAFLS